MVRKTPKHLRLVTTSSNLDRFRKKIAATNIATIPTNTCDIFHLTVYSFVATVLSHYLGKLNVQSELSLKVPEIMQKA